MTKISLVLQTLLKICQGWYLEASSNQRHYHYAGQISRRKRPIRQKCTETSEEFLQNAAQQESPATC